MKSLVVNTVKQKPVQEQKPASTGRMEEIMHNVLDQFSTSGKKLPDVVFYKEPAT